MTGWHKFWYRHAYLVAVGVVALIALVIATTAGCDPNTGHSGPMLNCDINHHIASKFTKKGDVVWYCAKGVG